MTLIVPSTKGFRIKAGSSLYVPENISGALPYPSTTDPNLIAYYLMDEGSGSTTADETATWNGTITGATWSDPGYYGYAGDKCLLFNGSSYVAPTGTPSFADMAGAANDFTVYAWFNTNTNAARQYICGDFNSGGSALGCSLELSASNGFVYDINGLVGRIRTTYAMGWSINTWYRAALRFNYTLKKADLFINGLLADTTTNPSMTNLQNTAAQQWRFGSGGVYTGHRFRGLLDNIIIYNDLRTDAEILADHA